MEKAYTVYLRRSPDGEPQFVNRFTDLDEARALMNQYAALARDPSRGSTAYCFGVQDPDLLPRQWEEVRVFPPKVRSGGTATE